MTTYKVLEAKKAVNGSIPNGKFSYTENVQDSSINRPESLTKKIKTSKFSTILRLLSFRRNNHNNNKTNQINLNHSDKISHLLSNSQSEIKSAAQESASSTPSASLSSPIKQTANKDNPITRLVRSFSFLYRRPKQRDEAFKRSKSQSIQNFRHSSGDDTATVRGMNHDTRKTNSLRNLAKGNSKLSLSNNVDFLDTGATKQQQSKSLVRSRRHLVSAGIDTPGVSGIQNHGNTCFINSVIQCLSNTDTLAEYFIFDRYRVQNQQRSISPNMISIRKQQQNNNGLSLSSSNELVEHFSILLQSIWSCMYSSEISFQFKRILSKSSSQYTGNDQHDAQEFLLWLLDRLHEELLHELNPELLRYANKIQKNVNHKNELESVQKNSELNTVIHQLFQGNLCSVVVCPKCEYVSKNFEPFLSLSLPVPIRLTFTIYVNIIFQDNKNQKKSGFYGVSIHAESTLKQLREQICQLMNVPETRVILLQKDDKVGINEFCDDTYMVQELFEDFTTIFALETPEVKATMNNALNGMCQQYLTIVWANQVKYERFGAKSESFGLIFTAIVSREISYNGLKSTIVRTMSEYLINSKEMQLNEFCDNFDITLKLIDTNNSSTNTDYFIALQNLEHPLFVEEVEDLLSKTELNEHYRGPYHIKLIVEWDNDVRRSLLVNDDEINNICEQKLSYIDCSVDQAKESSNLNSKVLLEDCLDTYFRVESLSADNAWMCPGCNSRQQCVKQLNIHTFPNILVVHLKRFRHRNKVNTMIDFPMNELDLSKYITPDRFKNSSESEVKVAKLIDIDESIKDGEALKYNLYGAVCHHGTMQGGHYTAYCKNPVDSSWYFYDDIKVIPVRAQQVLTSDSYILFYQKSSTKRMHNLQDRGDYALLKNVQNRESLKQSNLNLNHWSFRMPAFNYYASESYANRSKTLPLNNRTNKSVTQLTNHSAPANNKSSNTSSFNNIVKQHSNYRSSNHSKTSMHTSNSVSTGVSSGGITANGTALHPKITKYDRSSSRLSDYDDKPISNSLNTFPRSRSSQRI